MCPCNSGISGLFDNPEYATWGTDVGNPDYVDPSIYSSYPSNNGGYLASGGYGSGTNFWDALSIGVRSASNILGTRYSVPQLNPGQLIQTGPNGQSLMYQGTAGNMSMPSMSSLGAGGMTGMLPLLIGGAVLFMVMKK